jgi:type IV pilus assembly protein PilW
MVSQFMKLKPSSPDSNKGFTLVELLVTTLIASVVLGLSLSLITDQRKQYVTNQVRSENNQTLRAGLDLIGTDIKITGDYLESDAELPVVSVINNSSGDQLVLQRKMIPDVLSLCAPLSGSETVLTVAKNPPETGCGSFSDGNTNQLTDTLDAFKNYRCGIDGAAACTARTAPPTVGSCIDECVWAYIHDPVNDRGEFFKYGYEAFNNTSGTLNYIYKGNDGDWQYSYTYDSTNKANNPVIYILEERLYSLNNTDKVLELTTNRQTSDVKRLVNKVDNFQVQVSRLTSTPPDTPAYATLNEFNLNYTTAAPTLDWQTIQYIQVDLTATNSSDSDLISLSANQRQLSSKFFPRNALSKQ